MYNLKRKPIFCGFNFIIWRDVHLEHLQNIYILSHLYVRYIQFIQ